MLWSVRRVGCVPTRAVIGLLVDRRGFEHVELVALDLETFVREEEVVFIEARANATDEENRIGFAGVSELHDGALGPRTAVEIQLAAKRVEAFGGELLERVCPGQSTEFDARTVEMPPVVDVVVRRDDLRKTTVVRVIVEVNDHSRGHLLLVARQSLRGEVKAAIGKHRFRCRRHWARSIARVRRSGQGKTRKAPKQKDGMPRDRVPRTDDERCGVSTREQVDEHLGWLRGHGDCHRFHCAVPAQRQPAGRQWTDLRHRSARSLHPYPALLGILPHDGPARRRTSAFATTAHAQDDVRRTRRTLLA